MTAGRAAMAGECLRLVQRAAASVVTFLLLCWAAAAGFRKCQRSRDYCLWPGCVVPARRGYDRGGYDRGAADPYRGDPRSSYDYRGSYDRYGGSGGYGGGGYSG
jgi:hypothetical protein